MSHRYSLGFALVALLAMTSGCVVVSDDDSESTGGTGGHVTHTGGSTGEETGGTAGGPAETGGTAGSPAETGGTAGATLGGAAGAEQGGAASGGEAGAPSTVKSDIVSVDGATFVEGAAPEASTGSGRPVITSVQGIETLVNGGSGIVHVTFSDPQGNTTVRDAIVVVRSDTGYHRLTLDATSAPNLSSGELDLQVTMAEELAAGTVTFGFALVDADGNVSEYVEQSYEVVQTGTGDVKISLSFDQSTDVDLHVFDPSGAEIFYGARTSPSGGTLDLDSNASCSIDGVNNENVFWETGTAPAGEYIVNVEYYDNCNVTTPVNYVVTVINGTAVNTYSGTLSPDQLKTPIEVTRFTR